MADSKDEDSDDGLSSVADFVQIYMISIDVVGAHNIEKADAFGKSDPFCKVSAFSTSYTTCTIRKTLNPVWNERVEMTFFNDPKQLRFELFDYDGNTQDDAIGDCIFSINEDLYSPNNNGYSGKIKLQNCKSGELEIKVFARKLLPLEIEKELTVLNDRNETNTDDIEQLDQSINDWNGKIAALYTQINAMDKNIADTKAQISQKQQQLKDTQQEGERLNEEGNRVKKEVTELEDNCAELKKKYEELKKQLEDMRIKEDKKRTENERLREDLSNLNKRIQEKEEEKERLLKEEKDKEKEREREREQRKLEEEAEEAKQQQEEEEVEMRPTPQGNTDKQPLVDKGQVKKEQNDCCTIL
eukprot:144518_1